MISRFPFLSLSVREQHTYPHSHTRTHILLTHQCRQRLSEIFLPPSSRPDFSESGLKSGLTNLALEHGTINLPLSFGLCSIYHLHTWHSLHTHTQTCTRAHTPRSMFQSLSPPPPVIQLICENRKNTHWHESQ